MSFHAAGSFEIRNAVADHNGFLRQNADIPHDGSKQFGLSGRGAVNASEQAGKIPRGEQFIKIFLRCAGTYMDWDAVAPFGYGF